MDLSDPVVKTIVGARVQLLLKAPFFGNLATRLILKDASSWCKTAATDGRHLYYNREFIKSLTQAELLFLLGHEVLHCVYDHLGRRGARDAKIWNMANDYIVNYTLVEEKLGTMPSSGLYDKKYTDEMTSEEVYQDLMKNSTVIKMTLDEHIDPATGKSDGPGGEVEVRVMGTDGPPTLSDEEIEQIRNEIKAATIQAAQSVEAGKVPAGVRRLIKSITAPKMDWRAMLETHLQSTIRDDYTFQRMNRRSWSLGAILPGSSLLDTIDIAVAIDTSGSMTEEMLRDFLGEVKGIMEAFPDFRLTLFTFDTQVYGLKVFTPDNLNDIMLYDPKGGGGTVFNVCWEFMMDNDIQPERFVMFTDGYDSGDCGLSHENYCETLFVIYGGYRNFDPGFGQTAFYEDAKAN